MQKFTIDIEQITNNPNVYLSPERLDDIKLIEEAINADFVSEGWTPVQVGRVIALRSTDKGRKSSAFSSALYLGKYADMDNTERFLKSMVKAGHSYEPIRGESISFLFIGVSKPAYDHLITYTIRNRRIAGGLRANEPWGFVIPNEAKDRDAYRQIYERHLNEVLGEIRKQEGQPAEQLQALRSLYPTGVILPPFQFDFSEEALVKSVFRQRIWEGGAQGETRDIVREMWEAVRQLDSEKWDFLEEFHGKHITQHNKAMRTLRDKRPTVEQLINEYSKEVPEVWGAPASIDVYDLLMRTVGKPARSMWD